MPVKGSRRFACFQIDANQRTAITNTDNSRWAYNYDTLGQVTSGKRYWSDGSIVAGQQFEYAFDDIGNRLTAASGGDTNGANLRLQNYAANSLNQYTQRTFRPARKTSRRTVNEGEWAYSPVKGSPILLIACQKAGATVQPCSVAHLNPGRPLPKSNSSICPGLRI